MIKATDLIKREAVFTVNGHKFNSLKVACSEIATSLYKTKLSLASSSIEAERIKEKCIGLAARLDREFLREDIFEAEGDIFYFTLWLHHNPTLREVMQAFREDITFHGNVNISSINEIKKDFKKNCSRTSDICELFNKGYGAYLVKASFCRGDFEEPSYWDLEITSHYAF